MPCIEDRFMNEPFASIVNKMDLAKSANLRSYVVSLTHLELHQEKN